MICRLWHGWTSAENAAAYEAYLRDELDPRLERFDPQAGHFELCLRAMPLGG